MALDGGRLAACLARTALDDVGVDSALRQKLHRTAVLGQVLRHGEELLPELRAYYSALLFGVGHLGQKRRIALFRMHVHEIDVELAGEHLLHLFGLVLAQKAVVHEHAGKLLADSPCAQCGHHAGINPSRKAQNHAFLPHLRTDGGHRVIDDGIHIPSGLKPADAEQEVRQHLVAVRRVTHLGMELRGEKPALGAFHGSDRAHVGARRDREARGNLAHRVAMAHPHDLLGGRVAEKHAFAAFPVTARKRRRSRTLPFPCGRPCRLAQPP